MPNPLGSMNDSSTSCRCILLLAIALLLISGCSALGAKRLPRDRFDYSAAVGQSSLEQMMVNIVRSRYLNVPVFMTVSSVVTQYTYDRSIGVNGFRAWGFQPEFADRVGGQANWRFAENPTITYTPIAGEAFATHMYQELKPEVLFAAAQAGWSIDLLMRIGLHRFGAAQNMTFGEVRVLTKVASDLENLESFTRTITLLFILSDAEILEVHVRKEDEETGTRASQQYLVISEEVPEDMRPVLAEFRQLIGITDGNKFLLTDRITNLEDDEISIQTRSVMGMIKFMARGVEVPAEHLEEGRVVDFGLQEGGVAEGVFPFRMRSSENRPTDVFAAVPYGDYWYYIDHDDISSKRALEMMIVLFQLNAPVSEAGAAPLLTLPAR